MNKDYIQRLIDESIWIKETFGEGFLKLGSFYSITKKFKDYFHDGIYKLEFDLVKGMYFNSVGLKFTEDKELGLSQWILTTTIPLDSFWIDGVTLRSDFNNYTNVTEIHIIDKGPIFDDIKQYSWSFIIRTLDDIKAHGIEVPFELYPFERNKDYDPDKTMDFIKNNYFKS